MTTSYKSTKLINYHSNNLSNKKWFSELSNDNICEILNDYYLKNEKKEILNNVEKGNHGENKIENVLIKNNIPYIRTSKIPHSGDFICYDKIMIDSKNYKNNITKDQIDKLLFDMNIRKINNGIMIVFTDYNFKFELKNNIVILYVSSYNDDFLWLYLEIFLNYMITLPDNFSGDILCVDPKINETLNNYNNILFKLENMKNNLNIIINDIYNTNIELNNIINNSLYIKKYDNKLDDICCNNIIKKILSNINYCEISYNNEKIHIKSNNITILINYKKKNEAVFYIMNIDCKILHIINKCLLDLMNFLSINISNNQIMFTIKYDTDAIYVDQFIDLLNTIYNI